MANIAKRARAMADEIERLRQCLEDIALLDEADGHELTREHAFKAVAIATAAIGKHPSVISAERPALSERPEMRAFGASDTACYLWPDDTEEHRNLRAAYIRGAADYGAGAYAGKGGEK